MNTTIRISICDINAPIMGKSTVCDICDLIAEKLTDATGYEIDPSADSFEISIDIPTSRLLVACDALVEMKLL